VIVVLALVALAFAAFAGYFVRYLAPYGEGKVPVRPGVPGPMRSSGRQSPR